MREGKGGRSQARLNEVHGWGEGLGRRQGPCRCGAGMHADGGADGRGTRQALRCSAPSRPLLLPSCPLHGAPRRAQRASQSAAAAAAGLRRRRPAARQPAAGKGNSRSWPHVRAPARASGSRAAASGTATAAATVPEQAALPASQPALPVLPAVNAPGNFTISTQAHHCGLCCLLLDDRRPVVALNCRNQLQPPGARVICFALHGVTQALVTHGLRAAWVGGWAHFELSLQAAWVGGWAHFELSLQAAWVGGWAHFELSLQAACMDKTLRLAAGKQVAGGLACATSHHALRAPLYPPHPPSPTP